MGDRREQQVTVFMALYNAGPYLRESIASILNQTYSDFTFLIIDDGSTDGSVKIVESYEDPRIRLVHNEGNKGLIYTLNRGLKMIKTRYMVRQDADDVSVENRIEKLVDFMENHPDVTLCSSWFSYIGELGKIFKQPIEHEKIKITALSRCPLTHGAGIIKVDEFIRNNLWYSSDYVHAEDYEMLTRACQKIRMHNIPEPLYLYRLHKAQVSQSYSNIQQENDDGIRKKYISEVLQLNVDEHYLKLIRPLISKTQNEELDDVFKWAVKILRANETNRFFNQELLSEHLKSNMKLMLYIRRNYNLKLLPLLFTSWVHHKILLKPWQYLLFAARCLLNYKVR